MKHFTSWFAAGSLALSLSGIAAAEKPVERRVAGTTITSERDPAVEIRLPGNAKYAGAARWDLYGCCDAELHLFIEPDSNKRVQRLYWVQFESYLPNNNYTYDYPFAEETQLAGRRFDLNFRFDRTDQPAKPGSDFERVRMLVTQAGYHLAPETMQVRLVHLLDDGRRKELMFIYAEDLSATGATVEELSKPESQAKWEKLKADLLARAQERIRPKF